MTLTCPHCHNPLSKREIAQLLAGLSAGRAKRFTPEELERRRVRMKAINTRKAHPQMYREDEIKFLEFCVRQKAEFNPDEWLALPQPNIQKATVALFLANMPWFGHQAQLFELANRFNKGSVGRFSVLAKRTGFSPSRFHGLLQSSLSHEATLRV